MKNHRTALLGLAFAASFLSAGTATADDKGYVLASENMAPASITLVKQTVMEMSGTLNFQAQGKDIQGTFQRHGKEGETFTPLASDKFATELTEYEDGGEMEVAGRKIPSPPSTNPLTKVALVVKKTGSTWKAELKDGSPLSEEQAKKWSEDSVEETIQSDLALYGKEPRKPGDKWTVDASKLPRFSGFRHPSGSISCELKEIKDTPSGPAAVLKMTFEVTGTPPGTKPEDNVAGHMKGEISELRSIKYQTSLTFDSKGDLEMSGKAPGGVDLKMVGKLTATESVTVQKP